MMFSQISGNPWLTMETITLGPFAVRPDGALEPRRTEGPPALAFAWRGRTCRAELEPEGLRISADAARIPSTADPGADRRRAFAALETLPRHLPQGWRARLMPDHRVRVEAARTIAIPANATSLVTAMVRFVLELDPYLDTLEAEGVAWTSGTAKI